MRALVIAVTAVALSGLAACGGGDDDLVAFAVAGDNPVDGTLWCEPGDIVADLTATTSFPPNIEVPALVDDEAQRKTDDFIAMLFPQSPAADAARRLDHDGGPVATMTLGWRDEPDRAGGWLTFELVEGEWTVTGYTVCNRFAFGG
ncbi:MAG: hypothetical protein AAGA90_13665 [Actinomycetota bacterium]